MLLDKLTIINDALIATGNNPVQVADDNSDEWRVASSAYERMLPVVMNRGDWKFQTAIVPLDRLGTSNFPGYAEIYAKPADCLQLLNVWDTYYASLVLPQPTGVGMSRDGIRPPPLEYKIVGDGIHCTTQAGATALYVQQPTGASQITVLFKETLTREIQAIIAAGLNEDIALAAGMQKSAADQIAEARAINDAQEPRAKPFRSGMLEKRRSRHYVGGGWYN